jgi:hypothetical protein
VISWYSAVLIVYQSPSAFDIFSVSYITIMVSNQENFSACVSLSTLRSYSKDIGLLIVAIREISVNKIDTVQTYFDW